ncbi:MAG: peptidoglycan-binding protein [Polaribacter sp.]|nr:peptidoglycan-binding protein [Polaribacter sp.]
MVSISLVPLKTPISNFILSFFIAEVFNSINKVPLNSFKHKEKGLSNKEIKFLEENGIDIETYRNREKFSKIQSLFDPNINLYKGEKNAIIFEVQKRLVTLGYNITIDGVYRIETLKAIKTFEEKNNLLADGYIDALSLELLFK